MKIRRLFDWQLALAVILLSLATLLYVTEYLLFHDAHHIILYLIGDTAFLFIEVLIVTMILHRILTLREKRAMLKKLNMVIGAFYSEVGTHLIRTFSRFDPSFTRVAGELIVSSSWSDKDFIRIHKVLGGYAFGINHAKGDLEELKGLLSGKRQFLLGLLENPNLLEHESFTNLLWAVFHLTEELIHRPSLKGLPDADYRHLEGDITRAYKLAVDEWLRYMKHLKSDYPYLFSLAVRTNPFDATADVVVRK